MMNRGLVICIKLHLTLSKHAHLHILLEQDQDIIFMDGMKPKTKSISPMGTIIFDTFYSLSIVVVELWARL